MGLSQPVKVILVFKVMLLSHVLENMAFGQNPALFDRIRHRRTNVMQHQVSDEIFPDEAARVADAVVAAVFDGQPRQNIVQQAVNFQDAKRLQIQKILCCELVCFVELWGKEYLLNDTFFLLLFTLPHV